MEWDGWQGLAGSHERGGVSNTLGSSQRPSIAINAAGQPIVAWVEGSDIFVSQFDPAANGGQGAGRARQFTGRGRDQRDRHRRFTDYCQHHDGSSRSVVELRNRDYGRSRAAIQWHRVGGGGDASRCQPPDTSNMSSMTYATDRTNQAVAWSQLVAGVPRIYALEFAGSAWQQLAGSATAMGSAPSSLPAAQPTLAYHAGQLYAAWQQQIRTGTSESEIYAAKFDGTAWIEAGTGAFSGGGDLRRREAPHDRTSRSVAAYCTRLGRGYSAVRTEAIAPRFTRNVGMEPNSSNGSICRAILTAGSTGTGNGVRDFAMHVNASGQPFVAWAQRGRFAAGLCPRRYAGRQSGDVHQRGDRAG